MTSLDMNDDLDDAMTNQAPLAAGGIVEVDVTFVLVSVDTASPTAWVTLSQSTGLAFWGWASYFTSKTLTINGVKVRGYQVRATVTPAMVHTGADGVAALAWVTDQIADTLLANNVGVDPTYTSVHARLS